MKAYFRLIFQLGFGMAVAILSCFGLGLLIERFFNLSGLAIAGFTMLGVVLGLIYLYIMVMHLMETRADDHSKKAN